MDKFWNPYENPDKNSFKKCNPYILRSKPMFSGLKVWVSTTNVLFTHDWCIQWCTYVPINKAIALCFFLTYIVYYKFSYLISGDMYRPRELKFKYYRKLIFHFLLIITMMWTQNSARHCAIIVKVDL